MVDSARRGALTARRGFAAIEAIVALVLLLLVLQAAWTLTSGMAAGATALARRAESLAAARGAAWILQEELEGARAGIDVSRPDADSIALRAFRGTAFVCGARSPAEPLVRWAGLRTPDPAKDSVLVATASGVWVRSALKARTRAAGECAGSGAAEVERWTLTDSIPDAALLRFFERGSYHLSDETLRYRIGLGGRQPLTPPSFDPAGSGITGVGRDRLLVAVATRGARGGRGPGWLRPFVLDGGW
jgi:hypothetical protein